MSPDTSHTSNRTPREQFYRRLLEAFQGNILCVDKKGHIVYLNGHARQWTVKSKETELISSIQQAETSGVLVNSCVAEVLHTHQKAYNMISGQIKSDLVGIGIPLFDPQGNFRYAVSYGLPESLVEELVDTIRQSNYETERAQSLLSYVLHESSATREIIAQDPNSQELVRRLRRIGKYKSSVLLEGESGTGKEVYAHLLFDMSITNREVFVPVNCAAIPEHLMESEFFGYEAGAFTDASRKGKHGFFEMANHGTLFLDEIGELPLNMQAKLLRVLETEEFCRLGGSTVQKTDVRIVAATNRDLRKMMQEGRFREDLFFRLGVFHIHIPPLRERKDDIRPLAEFFLKRYNQKFGLNKILSEELLLVFEKYHWPGNVRELRNAIESMLITAPADTLIPQDFLEIGAHISNLKLEEHAKIQSTSSSESSTNALEPLKAAMHAFEREYIRRVYEANGHNGVRTAQALGIHPTGLYKKLKSYGISCDG